MNLLAGHLIPVTMKRPLALFVGYQGGGDPNRDKDQRDSPALYFQRPVDRSLSELCRLPPGLAETPGGRKGAGPGFWGQLSPPSARPPGWRVGPSASLLILQTTGLGSAGPDSAVSGVGSGLAARPGQPRVCKPVNPLLPRGTFPDFLAPIVCLGQL